MQPWTRFAQGSYHKADGVPERMAKELGVIGQELGSARPYSKKCRYIDISILQVSKYRSTKTAKTQTTCKIQLCSRLSFISMSVLATLCFLASFSLSYSILSYALCLSLLYTYPPALFLVIVACIRERGRGRRKVKKGGGGSGSTDLLQNRDFRTGL